MYHCQTCISSNLEFCADNNIIPGLIFEAAVLGSIPMNYLLNHFLFHGENVSLLSVYADKYSTTINKF